MVMMRKEIPREILMSYAPRKEYVSKLKITLVRLATQNQLPLFHLRTQIAFRKPTLYKAEKCCIVSFDPNNKCRLSEKDFVDDGVSPENELRRSRCVRTRE